MKGFLKRLGICAGCAALLGIFAAIFYGITKIPHIEWAAVVFTGIVILYLAMLTVTFIFCCFFWLFTGRWVFPDWMMLD